MTKENCIHYEICKLSLIPFMPSICKTCSLFLDKSNFIEIPCKIDDIVYVITKKPEYTRKKEIIKCKVSNMRIKQDGFTIVFSCRGNYESGRHYSGNFVSNSIGKTVFLSREDAIKVLENKKNE